MDDDWRYPHFRKPPYKQYGYSIEIWRNIHIVLNIYIYIVSGLHVDCSSHLLISMSVWICSLSLSVYIYTHILVGGLEHVLLFHSVGNKNLNWRTHIFQRGRLKPPTSIYIYIWLYTYVIMRTTYEWGISYILVLTHSRQVPTCHVVQPNLRWPHVNIPRNEPEQIPPQWAPLMFLGDPYLTSCN